MSSVKSFHFLHTLRERVNRILVTFLCDPQVFQRRQPHRGLRRCGHSAGLIGRVEEVEEKYRRAGSARTIGDGAWPHRQRIRGSTLSGSNGKCGDLPALALIEDREVVLGQVANRRVPVLDHHIHFDQLRIDSNQRFFLGNQHRTAHQREHRQRDPFHSKHHIHCGKGLPGAFRHS
jgi:hypothetical protein